MRFTDPFPKRPKEETDEEKREICARILASNLFYDTYDVLFLVDPDKAATKSSNAESISNPYKLLNINYSGNAF